jgi:hypothetical protein
MAILLIAIAGYSIHDYCWFFYEWLLVIILLVTIGGYFINGYLCLFY